MALLLMAAFFLFVVLFLAFFVFVGFRSAAAGVVYRGAALFGAAFRDLFNALARGYISGVDGVFCSWGRISAAARRYKWWICGTIALVCLPSVVVWLFRSDVDVGGFAEPVRSNDEIIAALLEGEQLVPPPALPPEVFATREVLAERPAIVSASRDWSLLEADFRQRLLHVFKRMREHGYEMVLIEGYRSPERQDMLAAAGPHVTYARAFQSMHQFGRAADCAFLAAGRLVISERDPWAMRGYELYGQEAEAVGLVWGGRWKLMDFGHVELRQKTGR